METKRSGRKGGGWGKKLLYVFGGLLLLVVLLYVVGTSSAFFKAVILPRVGKTINADITVESASISPFSRVVLQGLRVHTTGTEPLLTADLVRARYSLMDIIGGNINVEEVTLEKPVIQIITEPDGTSNLDPLLEGEEDKDAGDEEGDSDEPVQLRLQSFALKNGLVRQWQKTVNGASNITELRDINLTMNNLGNDQEGRVEMEAGLLMVQTQSGTNDLLQGTLSGGYDITLDEALLPTNVEGSSTLNIARAEGAFADLGGLNASLVARVEPTAIREVALRFARGEQQLGLARVHGPMNLETMDARLQVELVSIDRNMLNLATAGSQMDFLNTTFNSTNEIQISQNGTFVSATGNLAGREVSIRQQDLTTPAVRLDVDYQVSVDLQKESAVLRRLNVVAANQNQPFLRTSLDQEMNISWGQAVQGFREASLRMVLTNFNLADWRAVIGTNVSNGMVNMTMAVVAQQDGKLLNTTVNGGIQNLSAEFGTNQLQQAEISFAASGTIENLSTINFPEYSFTLGMQGERAVQASGAVRMNTETGDQAAQLTLDASLPKLLQVVAVPDVTASSGIVKMTAQYAATGGKQTAVGNLALESFTGNLMEYPFQEYRAALDYNVEINNDRVELRRVAATFNQGFESGGSFDLTGNYDMAKSSGRFQFKTVDMNQTAFRPFLAPFLGENQLVSISVDAEGSAVLDPEAETALKAGVQVANWVVQNPEGTLPNTPLSVGLNLDGGLQGEVFNLRELLVKLSPTERAENELTMQAKIDLATNNPAPGSFSLRSESLDLTPYYNMFASTPAEGDTEGESPAPAEPAPAEPTEETEPEPIELPFQQFVADLQIERLYLRELAISNWTGKITINSNVVAVDPFRMQMNGGDVNFTANVDVGVPGYKYSLAFGADQVPLEPLANTLGEPGSEGQLQGTLLAKGNISGAGVTGPSLQEHLGGALDFNLTNMNYQVVGPKLKRVLVPIALALQVPELAETPINWVSGSTEIGDGTVALKQFAVQSAAFLAESAGQVQLAPVLTNSTLNLPLNLSLRRSLAIKARVAAPTVPEDQTYVQIPQFVTVEGTLGAPEPNINKLALAGLIARTAANAGLGSDKVEEVLGGLGDVLGGSSAGGTNATGTNTGVGGLLKGLGGLFGDKSDGTNAPPAGTNEPPQEAPAERSPLDFFRRLQNQPEE